jgi:hypothetical protein
LKHWHSRAQRRAARRHIGASYPGCARTPRHWSDPQSEARAAHYCALAPVTHTWRLRPVPRGHGRLAPARAASRHWPSAPPHVATASRPSPSSRRPCSYRATASARPGHIKPPSPFSSRARAHRRRPPLAPPVSSPSCLSPRPTRSSKHFPSPYVSFQSRLMA